MGSNSVVEENHPSGNCNILTKSVGSSIKIDSISIDLVCPNDKGNAAKCEHFSLRGYVSEIRQKDWRKCWPFSLNHNPNKSVEQTCILPPLEVSNFKWWQCPHCLLEFGTREAANDYGTGNDHSTSILKSYGTGCSHGISLGDVSMLPSEFQEFSKLDPVEGRNFDVNSFIKDTDCKPSSCRDKKENETGVAKCPNIGKENGSEAERSHKIPPLCFVATEDFSNLIQKRHNPDGTVAECGQVEHPDRNDNCLAGINVLETCSKGNETSEHYQLAEFMTDCGRAEEDEKTLNANKRRATRSPSVKPEEFDCTSSESAEIPIGNNIRDHHLDEEISLHPRKTRKVRLLTELLSEKGDADSNHFRKQESSSNAIYDASADADTLSASQGMVAIQGNVRRMHANRKRKLPRDEEWRSLGTSLLDSTDERAGVLKRDMEITNAIVGPELGKDLFAGMGSQTDKKSKFSKYRTGKSPMIGKKKNGRIHLAEYLPLGLPQMEAPLKIQDVTGVGFEGNTDDVSLNLAHGEFVGREMDLFPLPDQRSKRKSTSSEKNGKVRQYVNWKPSLMPWNSGVPKQVLSMRKDDQIMPTVPASIPCQSAQLHATGRGLDLSPSSFLAVERCKGNDIPQEGGKASFLPGQKAISEDQALMSKCASDIRSKGPPFGCSGKKSSYGAPFFDEKRRQSSLLQSSDLSLLQKKDFCSESNGKKNIKISTNKDMDGADNGSEQVGMDDVTMEIVELMAKNQYERCLPDAENEIVDLTAKSQSERCLACAENDKIPLDLTNLTGNLQTRDLNKPGSSGAFSSLQEEAGCKQKPNVKNDRNGEITRCEIVGSSKQKSADNVYPAGRNHFTMSQLGQSQTTVGSNAFIPHPDDQSNGFRYSSGSSSRQNGSENCKWIGDLVEKRPPNASSWQPFGPCSTSKGVPWQSKAEANIWPSILSNNSPFIHNVPQKFAAASTDTHLLSYCPGTLYDGNTNGKHKKIYDSKPVGRTHEENHFACRHDGMKLQHKMSGSLDRHTNETIPAMQLLTLMDAGFRSGKPSSMDVNPKFLKKPLMSYDSQPDVSALESVVRSPSYDYYSKNKFQENSNEPVSTFPVVSALASLFQQDRSTKKPNNFPGEGPQKSRENKKRETSNSSAQTKGCGPQKSLSAEGGFGTDSRSVPAHCKQKTPLGTSDPTVFPARFMQGSTKRMLEAPCATGTPRPLKRSSETEACSINRNPADFSLPEAGNLYTIGGEDLKFSAAVTRLNRSGLEKFDGRKRQPKIHGRKQLIQHQA